MTIPFLLTQPATITPRTPGTTKDEYGNTAMVDGTPFDTVGYFEQTQATEVLVDRQTYISDWLIVLHAGTPVSSADRITHDGQSFELVGPPWPVWNPRLGVVSHIECRSKAITG